MKTLVITLPEAEERRTLFTKDCPLTDYSFYMGKGKEDVNPPNWFRSQKTHWALIENYIDILEHNQDDDLLIFEDDCTFCDDFKLKYNLFRNTVLDDWDILYLGVIHKRIPRPISKEIDRVTWGLSSHAIIYKKESIPYILRLLKAPRWKGFHGYDERLGLLEDQGLITAYAPKYPLCGQRAGYSYIMEMERGSYLL